MTELKEITDVIQDNDEQAVVHIREVMADFQCHKVVMVAVIKQVSNLKHNGISIVIGLPGTDLEMPYNASEEMIARYTPVIGDYVVLYENDYVSISPKKVFEDGYRQIEFTNLGDDELNIPTENMDQITAIAKMCHGVLSAYCLALREEQLPWDELSDEARDKIIGRVAFLILNPEAKPQANHDIWMFSY